MRVRKPGLRLSQENRHPYQERQKMDSRVSLVTTLLTPEPDPWFPIALLSELAVAVGIGIEHYRNPFYSETRSRPRFPIVFSRLTPDT